MTDQQFLDSNAFLMERIDLGIDIYPSDSDLVHFKTIAKTLTNQHFTIYGCQECVVALVKYVYNNYKEPKANGKV